MEIDLSYWGDEIHLWHQSRAHLGFCVCPVQLSNGKFTFSVFCPAGDAGSYPNQEFDTVEQAIEKGLWEVAQYTAAIIQTHKGNELLAAGTIDAIEYSRINSAAWSWLKERQSGELN